MWCKTAEDNGALSMAGMKECSRKVCALRPSLKFLPHKRDEQKDNAGRLNTTNDINPHTA